MSPTHWRLAYGAIVLGFLAMVGSYYSPQNGFTTFLTFPAARHSRELPAVQVIPHAHNANDDGYDGQFYAQMAVDPLLRDPAIDRALDTPGYRSHRILFSWTAWAMGLGRPAWILQAYAFQNVAAWLCLAGILLAWCPPRDGKTFLLWAGVLFSHGLLSSVRNALPDGPSLMLIATAVLAADRGRPWLSALVTGIAGLARETNVLTAIAAVRSAWRSNHTLTWRIVKVVVILVLCVAPLALWMDYLRSIYGAEVLSGGRHLTWPLSGLWWKLRDIALAVGGSIPAPVAVANVASLLGFIAQAGAVLWCAREYRRTSTRSSSWLPVALVFLALALVTDRVVWEGTPGAYTRVILPLTFGVNVLLAAHRAAPWWLIVAANLGVISGLTAFGLRWI